MGRPLEGIRVLACEIQVAGPYCTMMLADQGADVVKVERPGAGDTAREGAPILTGADGQRQSGYFLRFNRNKRSITVNLKTDAGREVFRALAARADVLVDNFRPGWLDGLGLGYGRLSRDNPRLIYASITGFGSLEGFRGPYSNRPAYDIVAQAMGGLMHTCGQADGPPTWLGIALGDIASGMLAAYAIMLALWERQHTGRGQYVDISMYDAVIALAERSVTAYSLTGLVLERGKEPFIAPWGPFRCRDGWVALIVPTEGDWEKFCRAMGRPDLVGHPDTSSGPARAASMAGWLGDVIRSWFAERSVDDAVTALLAAGVPAGPVQTARDVYHCPHVRARQLLVDIPDPVLGSVRLVGPPVKMSASPHPRREPAPLLGQHTQDVIVQWLGYTPDQVAALRRDGALGGGMDGG
ncbi:MAG: CoA transferase [Armatimonadota bacterium]|nr:CoA transferase [Armatimonadota bacterium]